MPRSLLVALVVLASAAGAHAATPKAPVAKPAAQRRPGSQGGKPGTRTYRGKKR